MSFLVATSRMNRFSVELEISDVDASFLPGDDQSSFDSDSDAIDSEVEFHLYSQLHYSSNYGDEDKKDIVTSSSSDSDVTEDENDDSDDEKEDEVDSSVEKKSSLCMPTEENQIAPTKIEDKKARKKSDNAQANDDTSTDKVGPFKREDITLLKEFLEEDDDFIPETWEIIDSVTEDDSDDEGLDIHINTSAESVSEEDVVDGEDYSVPKVSQDYWQIDDRDRSSFKQESKGRYYGDTPTSRQRCKNCNEAGHFAKDCSQSRKQPVCFVCGDRGHIGRDCSSKKNFCFVNRNAACNRCGQFGHIKRECPDNWRQFHMTTEVGPIVIPEIPVQVNENAQCFNCASNDHFGHECEDERNDYYSPFQSVFVCEYDEYATSKRPGEASLRQQAKRRKPAEYSQKRRPSSSNIRKQHPHKKRQHIIFDSSSSDSFNHGRKHGDRHEHSTYKNDRSRSDHTNRHSRHRSERTYHSGYQAKHDRSRTQTEERHHHQHHHHSERNRKPDIAESPYSHKSVQKRTKSPEIVYHNTRKVVLNNQSTSTPRRTNDEFLEPFPRSKKSHNRETDRNAHKKARYDDWGRKVVGRGFNRKYK